MAKKPLIQKNRNADLRVAYLLAFDNFSTNPVEVGEALKANSRYGRELLGILVNAGLVVDDRVNGGEYVWQCAATYDSVTREEAEATIDAFLAGPTEEEPEPALESNHPRNRKPDCRCGCKAAVNNRNSTYLPGHDARHAGNVGRAMIARRVGSPNEAVSDLLEQLPTAALRDKAWAMVTKAAEKAQASRTLGTVKKGRWIYPAMRDEKGTLFINRSRHGGKEWDEVTDAKVADTFAPAE